MRRKDHPSLPSAITCCFFSSLKTLLMPREPIRASPGVNVPGSAMAGFQPTLYGRIWVTAEDLYHRVTGYLDGPTFEGPGRMDLNHRPPGPELGCRNF